MSQPEIRPGDVWFVDFDPVRGHEQGKDRPALVVSSHFHLEITGASLVAVLPLTTRERTAWLHRVAVAKGWVITEQVRTMSVHRFRRYVPELTPTDKEFAEVRRVLARMLTV